MTGTEELLKTVSSFPELVKYYFICHGLMCSIHLHSSIFHTFLLLPGVAHVPEIIPVTMLNDVMVGGDWSQKLQ